VNPFVSWSSNSYHSVSVKNGTSSFFSQRERSCYKIGLEQENNHSSLGMRRYLKVNYIFNTEVKKIKRQNWLAAS
jgi:hypothetical protein